MELPSLLLLPLLLLFPAALLASGPITDLDVQIAATVLRNNNLELFANAILSSDLRYQLASSKNASYTFFAPPDRSVYLLDLELEASHYVHAISRQVVLGSFSIADLLRFPVGSTLKTLIPKDRLVIRRRNGSNVVEVDGIQISSPDLYLTSRISIHGVDGFLSGRSAPIADRIPRHVPVDALPSDSGDRYLNRQPSRRGKKKRGWGRGEHNGSGTVLKKRRPD